MAAIRFGILGPLTASDAHGPVRLAEGRQRALLAVLILHANEVVASDALVEELWNGSAPASAHRIVQTYVSQLRKALGESAIETHGRGYRLQVGPGGLDCHDFERALESGRDALARGDASAAAARLREGLALWRDAPLTEFAYEPFAQREIARLQEQRLEALELRIEADLELGRHRALVAELEALVAVHPLRERLRGQLMLALYRCGRQGDALALYDATRRLLASELGIEPGAALQCLHREILAQDPALDLVAAPDRGARAGLGHGAGAAAEPAAGGRTRRTRRLALAGAAALAVAAAVVVALTAGGGAQDAVAAPPDSLAAIDPRTGEVVAAVPLGTTPTSVAASGDAAWAINADDRTISRVDSRSLDVQTFGTATTPLDLAVGEGGLWVAGGAEGTRRTQEFPGPLIDVVAGFDPRSSAALSSTRLPTAAFAGRGGLNRIAAGAGAVWVIAPHGRVLRLDPHTGAIEASIDADADALAVDSRRVVALTGHQALLVISPRTNRRVRSIDLPAYSPGAIALTPGAIWVTDAGQGLVWRVEDGPSPLPRTIDVGGGASAIAAGAGGVWVANALRGTVTRLDPDSGRVTRTIALGGAPRAVAATPDRVWVTVGGVAGARGPAVSSAAAGVSERICGPVLSAPGVAPDVLVVSDLALQASPRFPTRPAAQAVEHVLRQHGFRAGRWRVGYQSCDNSTAQSGIADDNKCAANARAYAAEPRVVGVVGLQSSCAMSQLPILNRASLALAGPFTYTGLTRHDPTAPRGELASLYPSGRRTLARTVPGDDVQAAGDAILLRLLGARRVFVLHDGSNYGRGRYGTSIVAAFRAEALRQGMDVVGLVNWSLKDPREVARRVARSHSDGVFLAGVMESGMAPLVRALRERLGPRVSIVASDGVLPISTFIGGAGDAARTVHFSVVGPVADRLPAPARAFTEDFATTQPDGEISLLAVWTAAAAEDLLDAIARSDGTRASVTHELLSPREREGLLGRHGYTRAGDTTLRSITVLRPHSAGGSRAVASTDGAVVERELNVP